MHDKREVWLLLSPALSLSLGVVPPVVGLSLQFALPLESLSLRTHLRELTASSARSPMSRITAKEQLLRRYAVSKAQQRNWFAHAGPLFLRGSVGKTSNSHGHPG
ncbi:MAG: hypothetical protein ACPGUV_03220 [Polyangiales bacterium]